MLTKYRASLMACLMLAYIHTADAHHGLDSEFDQTQVVSIVGVISKVDWINPHIYFTIDVPQADGSVIKWQAESVPVALAHQVGVTAKSLMGNGTPVTVTGFAARKEPHFMFGNKITYSDGHTVTWAGYKG